MKKRLTKTNFVLIISLALLVLTGSLYLYFNVRLNKNLSELANLRTELQKNQDNLSNLEKAELNLRNILGTGDEINKVFIDQEEIVKFLASLENLLVLSHTKGSIDSVTETDDAKFAGTDKERLSLAMSAIGDWNHVAEFISLLETLPLKVTVDAVRFSFGTNTSNTSTDKKPQEVKTWKATVSLSGVATKSSTPIEPTQATSTNTDQ